MDGERHFSGGPGLKDKSKRIFVEAHGIRVIRFENKMIFEDIERVLDIIRSNFG